MSFEAASRASTSACRFRIRGTTSAIVVPSITISTATSSGEYDQSTTPTTVRAMRLETTENASTSKTFSNWRA